MNKKNNIMLFLAIFWIIMTVISSEILARVIDMALAISCSVSYLQAHFQANSTQKLWLNRFNIVSLAVAAVFLVLRVYCMFVN